jgi:hypothetical protein
MPAYVVDENVPIVANDSSRQTLGTPQADAACRDACVRALNSAVKSGLVVIDDEGVVLGKYREHLKPNGQPGVGYAFFKHVIDRQFDRKKVRRTSIQPNGDREFEVFPVHASLATFDRSDRIYVALALAAPQNPVIINAVDSDYAEYREALEYAGVFVKELCLNCVRVREGKGT